MKKSLTGIIILIALALPLAVGAFTPRGMLQTDANLQEQINYLMSENEQLKTDLANLRIEIDGIRNEVKETKSLIDILLGLLKQLQSLVLQVLNKLLK